MNALAPLSTRRRGFTLVELLLVVALMMLAAMAIVSNIDALLPATRVEATARMLAADISSARASAIAQGLPYEILYDLDKSTYQILTPFRPDGSLHVGEEERAMLEEKDFPPGVKLVQVDVGTKTVRQGTCRIPLQPNGNTIEHVVYLDREVPPGKIYLVVQGLTGFVQLYTGDWHPDSVSESDFR